MHEDFSGETRKLSHVVLIITITVFSIVLVSLNFRQGWEKWTIPVICAVVAFDQSGTAEPRRVRVPGRILVTVSRQNEGSISAPPSRESRFHQVQSIEFLASQSESLQVRRPQLYCTARVRKTVRLRYTACALTV